MSTSPLSALRSFRAPGAGAPKVDLAAAHVRSVNPWTDLAVVHADLASLTPGVFSAIDVSVLALDNHRARFQAARLLMAAGVPYVDVASLAPQWHARVTVCDPARVATADPAAPSSCLLCSWSSRSLARAGEDVGYPCAGLSSEPTFASSLTMGQRAATLASREALALAGATDLTPSVGCEIRDDLLSLRLERFVVPADEEHCAGHHALACREVKHLDLEPSEVRLGSLAHACGIGAADSIVLASREVVTVAMCVVCFAAESLYCRTDRPRSRCRQCGGEMAPVRRTRRLRWGTAAERVEGALASDWFGAGDRFAAVGESGARSFAFPPRRLAWQSGEPWSPEERARRFERLPRSYRLERIRRTRLAIVGVGHVGAAVLHQLAPLPWAGLLLVDRDRFETRNAAAYALATAATLPELRR